MVCRLFSAKLRAFTLVELSVSLAIMTTLMAIMLAKYPNSEMSINLANYTHTLALLVREAQLRGSAVDTSSGAYGGYGVYFSRTQNTNFVLFGDSVETIGANGIGVGNGLLDYYPGIAEVKSTTTLPVRFSTSKLCVDVTAGRSCNNQAAYGIPFISTLTISFTRPNPAAHIYLNDSTATEYSGACIEISSPLAPTTGHVRSVLVTSSGMITTSYSPCQ